MSMGRSTRITMVKKRLSSGEPCAKCLDVQRFLEDRGLWSQIDEVVWADESDPDSAGWKLAQAHGVELAPFFVVADDAGTHVHTSALQLARALTAAASTTAASTPDAPSHDDPASIVRWALERWGADCTIAFSGAEDVVLIDLAAKTGLPFSVFSLDTGRLFPETLAFLDTVRERYGISIDIVFPSAPAVEALVRAKGTMSFRIDGHHECCAIRKVEPLTRALASKRAWMTGLRPDQSPATRGDLPLVETDPKHKTPDGVPLVKVNPLARWTSADVWRYLREHDVATNPLHLHGYRSIGCAPCTRPVDPGQHEREGRWWWEEATHRECGLHST